LIRHSAFGFRHFLDVIREIYHAVIPRLRDEGGWRRPIHG